MRYSSLKALFLLGILASPAALFAQDAASWRGAWIADEGGQRVVLYLVSHDGKVSGTYCFDCANPDGVSIVDDGTLVADGLNFNLYVSTLDGSSHSVIPTEARFDDGALRVTLNRPESEATTLVMRRGAPWVEPPPDPAPATPPAPARPRELPGAPETLTPEMIAGLWLTGSGPRKQYFSFKQHKDTVRGLVCGPCDNPHNFAPLENARIEGNRLHFDIVHEDNGFGFVEHGPFRNVTVAQMAGNEMQMTTYASFEPDGRKYELTLLGPVRYMPAQGAQP
jgi:hypothetical protein